MSEPSYFSLKPKYRKLWDSAILTRAAAADKAVAKILANRKRYEAVARRTSVPFWFIAVTHMRESSNNFAGVLHNGEHIIGTGRKTRLVPKGRGPFDSWEEAAIDALRLKGLHRIKDWTIERVLYECERFNGWGYHWKGRPSPYVWAGTKHYVSGKYVADGKYDASHVDTQLGVAVVLKRLEAAGVPVDAPTEFSASSVPPPPDIEPVDPPARKGWFRSWGARVKAGLALIGFSGIGAFTDWQIAAAFFVFALIMVGIAIAVFFWIFDAKDVRDWLRKQVA